MKNEVVSGTWSDEQIESKLRDSELNWPRITLDHIHSAISEEKYAHVEHTTVTVCVLKLKNGFNVVGHSACVYPHNFDEKVGREIAKKKAIDKCWELFGFHLASLHSGWTMDS